MNEFVHIIDTVGYYGPNLLFFVTLYFTWPSQPYFIAFLIGFFINLKINEVLKHWIREPRPKHDETLVFKYEEPHKGPHLWGMPSAHAQMTFFAISYLYFVTKSAKILAFSTLIGINTVYQRYKSQVHTAKQLAAGTLIGIVLAYLTYTATKWAKTRIG
jgi:membrane-associated phospholipid phosphatase